MPAVTATRTGKVQIELFGIVIASLFQELETVVTPLALHHYRKTVNDDIQEAANNRPENEQGTEI
jgi:hypothetical protein